MDYELPFKLEEYQVELNYEEEQSVDSNAERGEVFKRNHHCPASTEFKSDYAAVLVMNYSPTCNPYLRNEPLLDSCFSIAINMINVRTSYIPSQLEPAMTYSWWQTIHIPFLFLSNKFHLGSFFPWTTDLPQRIPPWQLQSWYLSILHIHITCISYFLFSFPYNDLTQETSPLSGPFTSY